MPHLRTLFWVLVATRGGCHLKGSARVYSFALGSPGPSRNPNRPPLLPLRAETHHEASPSTPGDCGDLRALTAPGLDKREDGKVKDVGVCAG